MKTVVTMVIRIEPYYNNYILSTNTHTPSSLSLHLPTSPTLTPTSTPPPNIMPKLSLISVFHYSTFSGLLDVLHNFDEHTFGFIIRNDSFFWILLCCQQHPAQRRKLHSVLHIGDDDLDTKLTTLMI